jgi:hypothetical protein
MTKVAIDQHEPRGIQFCKSQKTQLFESEASLRWISSAIGSGDRSNWRRIRGFANGRAFARRRAWP